MAVPKVRTHLIIPDCQVKPGVPLDFLGWIGQYILDRRPDVIVQLGDFADMESLSSYDIGKRVFEGRRYKADIETANRGMDILCAPLEEHNAAKAKWRKPRYEPEMHLLLGNHEDRISRATNDDPKLDGTIGLSDLDYEAHGWTVHDFLKPIELDGIWYSHYWTNGMGRPIGGAALTRLKTIGHSFVQGHQQTFDYACRFLANGQRQFGLIVGAAYQHEEQYLGPQGNAHWRGIVMLHEVDGKGSADLMQVSLDYLCRKYEGQTLAKFCARRF